MAFPTAAAFRDHVERIKFEFIMNNFLGFQSSQNLSHIPDNKGKEVIQRLTYNRRVLRDWKKLEIADFTQHGDIAPIEVESHLCQFRDTYTPTELEKSYAGEWRKRGQDPKDFPFMDYFVQEAGMTIQDDLEDLVWQARVGHPDGHAMAKYDAILEQIKDAITASDLTANVMGTPGLPAPKTGDVPAGTVSIIEIMEEMYALIPEKVKKRGIAIYCRPGLASMYNLAYRNVFGSHVTVDPQLNRVILDNSLSYGPAVFMPSPGMGDSNRIIMTPMANAYYTYDMDTDAMSFNFQDFLNSLYMWSDFRVGSGIHILEDDWCVVNELE